LEASESEELRYWALKGMFQTAGLEAIAAADPASGPTPLMQTLVATWIRYLGVDAEVEMTCVTRAVCGCFAALARQANPDESDGVLLSTPTSARGMMNPAMCETVCLALTEVSSRMSMCSDRATLASGENLGRETLNDVCVHLCGPDSDAVVSTVLGATLDKIEAELGHLVQGDERDTAMGSLAGTLTSLWGERLPQLWENSQPGSRPPQLASLDRTRGLLMRIIAECEGVAVVESCMALSCVMTMHETTSHPLDDASLESIWNIVIKGLVVPDNATELAASVAAARHARIFEACVGVLGDASRYAGVRIAKPICDTLVGTLINSLGNPRLDPKARRRGMAGLGDIVIALDEYVNKNTTYTVERYVPAIMHITAHAIDNLQQWAAPPPTRTIAHAGGDEEAKTVERDEGDSEEEREKKHLLRVDKVLEGVAQMYQGILAGLGAAKSGCLAQHVPMIIGHLEIMASWVAQGSKGNHSEDIMGAAVGTMGDMAQSGSGVRGLVVPRFKTDALSDLVRACVQSDDESVAKIGRRAQADINGHG
jgi:hypothetical protein